MASRNVGRTGVDKLAVHLIGEEIQVVLLHEVADLIHLTARIEVARRVVRIAYHDSLGALVDELLEALHLGQAESLLNSGGDGADDRSR